MDPLTSFSEEERVQALERFQVLRPHLEEDIALVEVSAQAHIPLRTAQRWLTLYRQHGLAGLTRKQRADCGELRWLSRELRELIEGMALQTPRVSAAVIHRRVSSLARQRDEKPPSYSLVYKIIRQMPPALTMLAHEGTKNYSQTFDLLHRREAEAPNALWQADHCLLDIMLLRDGQEPARPWLTTIIDDYSRAIAGYYLSFDAPSTLNTSLALRQGIWRKEDPRWHLCGIPAAFYTDNGTDFTSRHLEQVSADLKIRLIFSTPGKPRGRGRIERFFETLNQMLLSEQPGYCPPEQNPSAPRLSLVELDRLLHVFIVEVYHQRIHSDTKMAPQARWEAGGFLPQMAVSLEQLDLLLLTVPTTRKVHRDGIRFQGLRYLALTLAAYVGEEVLLRYDPRDMAEIRVFYQDHFLCRAICEQLAGETISLRDILRARRGRQRELRKTIEERQKTVTTLLQLRQGIPAPEATSPPEAPTTVALPAPLKRYFNE